MDGLNITIKRWEPDVDLRTVSARTDRLRPLLKRWRLKPGEAALVTNATYNRARLVFHADDGSAGVIWFESDTTRRVLGDLFKAACTFVLNGWPRETNLTIPAYVYNNKARLRAA